MLRSAGSSTHCRLLLGSGSPALSADELGRPDKARDLHERALRIFEREYGPDHVRVAITLTNLGNAWRELRRPDKARDLHERVLRIEEPEYGPDHVEVARTLTNLGNA